MGYMVSDPKTTISVNFFLSYRSDAGQRPTAASSAEVAEEDAAPHVNDDLTVLLETTQLFHNRHNDDDDVARSVRFCRHISHSRGCR